MTTNLTNQVNEQWRLMTAVERAEILTKAVEPLAELAEDDKAPFAINHILQQAQDLDIRENLVGATGESNECYLQARGLTLITSDSTARPLPIIIQLVSALITGNSVIIEQNQESNIITKMVDIMDNIGSGVLSISDSDTLSDPQLAYSINQVASVGTLDYIQKLAKRLSQTDGILTQLIAISDQQNLSEIFTPDYLHRFCTERVLTINTTAIGGNASLLEMQG